MAEGVDYDVSDSWRLLDVAVKVEKVEVAELFNKNLVLLLLLFSDLLLLHSRPSYPLTLF